MHHKFGIKHNKTNGKGWAWGYGPRALWLRRARWEILREKARRFDIRDWLEKRRRK